MPPYSASEFCIRKAQTDHWSKFDTDISWLGCGYCCRIYCDVAASNPECQRSSPRVALRAEAPFKRPALPPRPPTRALTPRRRRRLILAIVRAYGVAAETATVATDERLRQELRTG